MRKFVLDTSFAYSLIGQRDSNHNRAIKVFEEISPEGKLIFPEITYLELICGVADVSDIDDLVDVICKGKIEKVNNTDINFVKKLDYIIRRKLKAGDCQIMAIAFRNNAELLTFDKNLSKTFEKLKM